MNLTLEHFASFAIMAYCASFVAKGAQLYRLLGWLWLWQVFTPVRPVWLDIPLMVAAWAATEWLYLQASRLWTQR
jgi:hypothetical protein